MNTMDDEAAEWVRLVVLPSKVRQSYGTDDGEGVQILRICACQYGPCGYCNQLGKHDKCTTWDGFGGKPRAQPLTWIANREGGCIETAAVWPKFGRPCRWFCSCPICWAKHAEEYRRPPVYTQSALF